MRARRAGARPALVFLTAAALVLTVGTLVTAGCSDPSSDRPPVEASSGDKLAPGTAYSVDLDADGSPEQVVVDGDPATLTIRDGDVVYHSRDKWQVVEAHVGDTDHDGLLEVVTLVDGDDGRHIGLFAYFGGEYRERLVTQELSPRPLSLQVVDCRSADRRRSHRRRARGRRPHSAHRRARPGRRRAPRQRSTGGTASGSPPCR